MTAVPMTAPAATPAISAAFVREVEGGGPELLAGTPPPDVVVEVDVDVGVELEGSMEGALVTDVGDCALRHDVSSDIPTFVNSSAPPCRPSASCM